MSQRRVPGRRLSAQARGFTLIEMMIVVAVLAILATIAVPDLTPAVHRARHRGASEELVGFLEKARRQARAEGRCYRVAMSGNSFTMQARITADCATEPLDPAGWEAPSQTLNPPLSVFYQLETLPPAALPEDAELIFRPNGRVRGNGNLDITDDGARVLVGYQPLGSERWVIIVTTAGRIGGFRYGSPPGEFVEAVFPGNGFGAGGTTSYSVSVAAPPAAAPAAPAAPPPIGPAVGPSPVDPGLPPDPGVPAAPPPAAPAPAAPGAPAAPAPAAPAAAPPDPYAPTTTPPAPPTTIPFDPGQGGTPPVGPAEGEGEGDVMPTVSPVKAPVAPPVPGAVGFPPIPAEGEGEGDPGLLPPTLPPIYSAM